MKTDMSGAATAWGAINLVAQNKIDVGLTVYTPLVENMPSGTAIRPGDVLTTRNGKTIEVLNTDAEGRLIMADALAYAAEKKTRYNLRCCNTYWSGSSSSRLRCWCTFF